MFPRFRIFKWLIFICIVCPTSLFIFLHVLSTSDSDALEQFRQLNPMKFITSSTKAIKYETPAYKYMKALNLEAPGEGGVGVKLQNLTEEMEALVKVGWARHEFNEFLSDMISVRRSLPDPRNDYCKQEDLYLKDLPKTSVIIIFHNEAWSTLLRSVHSVLDRSPEHLLEEIILVDDFSNMDHLKKPLEDYMAQFPKVKILRSERHEGLIKARIRGAVEAKAPTLTFLDSHIECAPYWLEPLLDRIARDPTNVVCPVIETISDSTFKLDYCSPENVQVGGFDWSLTFNWHVPRKEELERRKNASEPLRSPTMAGGLFSIDTAFFKKLGMYDPEFEFWGSEHLELSFKTWMCGGRIEFIPCSRVGHVFRAKSPHRWTGNQNAGRKNAVRLAEVWMDEYKDIFYKRTNPDKGDFGDISDRVKLRKDLGCESFKWYLENICPEIDVPNNFGEGQIQSKAEEKLCLDGVVKKHSGKGTISMYVCHGHGGNQFFEFTKRFEIRKEDHCFDYDGTPNGLKLYSCHSGRGNQKWFYNITSSQIMKKDYNRCLELDLGSKNLLMTACDDQKVNQKWTLQFLYEEKFKNINENDF